MRAGSTAVAVSIGLHIVLAGGVMLLLRRQADERPVAAAHLETRADVHLEFVKDAEPPPEPNSQFVPDPPAPPPPQPTPEPPIEIVPDGPPKAQAIVVPNTLPPELLAILRKPQPASPIQQAAAVEPKPKAPAWAESGSPVHGALDANQRIVYVLDASGSMGEWAKFDAARAALIATLKLQPPTVRFQVVVYAGSAFAPVKSAPNECLAATPANLARTIEALSALPSPAGRSQHLEGLRAALAFRPDLVVFFTDADDLPRGPVRGLLKQADRKAVLCLANATAKGVEPPVEVK